MKKTPHLFTEYHKLTKKLDSCDDPANRVPNIIAEMIKSMFKSITGLTKRKIIDLGCGAFSLAQALYDNFLTKGIRHDWHLWYRKR